MSANAALIGFEQVRVRWGWFLAIGIILIVIGVIALAFVLAVTLVRVLVLGWLLFTRGVLEGILRILRPWLGPSASPRSGPCSASWSG